MVTLQASTDSCMHMLLVARLCNKNKYCQRHGMMCTHAHMCTHQRFFITHIRHAHDSLFYIQLHVKLEQEKRNKGANPEQMRKKKAETVLEQWEINSMMSKIFLSSLINK